MDSRCGPSPGNRHGVGAAFWLKARAFETFSATRLVPIRHRSSQPRCDRTDDDSFISRLCVSHDSGQAWQGLLRIGDDAWGAWKHHRNRRIVRLARCGNERFAGKISDHEVQGMDAKCPRALVACVATGNSNIRPVVRPAVV